MWWLIFFILLILNALYIFSNIKLFFEKKKGNGLLVLKKSVFLHSNFPSGCGVIGSRARLRI